MASQRRSSLSSDPTPADLTETAERILDAAEQEFSRAGFGGAGMKAIATAAGVAQGLLHYHFGTKEKLYSAVVERRAVLVTAGRSRLLDAIDPAADDAVPRLFEAFFRPPLSAEGGGPVYARIFATLSVGNERDQALVARHYDPMARRFIDVLMSCEPDTDRATAAWAYSFALGMLVGTIGRDGRIARLGGDAVAAAGDPAGPEATEQLIAQLTRHATGGFHALRAQAKSQECAKIQSHENK